MSSKSKARLSPSVASVQRRSRKLPTKTVLNTCAVTGERRDYQLSAMTVADHDRIHYHHEPGWLNGYRVALPLRIHVGTPDGMGAPQSSPQMKKYWGEWWNGRPRQPRRADTSYAERFWWTPWWAERELRANFPADAVDVVLAVRRDQQSWDMAMVGCERAIADVKLLMRQMADHCQAIIRGGAQAA